MAIGNKIIWIFFTQAGTGFSDDDLLKHNEFFKQHIIDKPRPYYRFGESVRPDHWFDAVQVSCLFFLLFVDDVYARLVNKALISKNIHKSATGFEQNIPFRILYQYSFASLVCLLSSRIPTFSLFALVYVCRYTVESC